MTVVGVADGAVETLVLDEETGTTVEEDLMVVDDVDVLMVEEVELLLEVLDATEADVEDAAAPVFQPVMPSRFKTYG